MAITTTPVAVGEKTAADWGNRVYADLQSLGITKAQSGTANVTVTASTSGTVTVTFGTAFAAVPVVVATIKSGAGTTIGATLRTTAVGATSFQLLLTLAASTTVTVPVDWIALD